MLQYLRRPGKHAVTHTQHDSFRKLKSAYRNWLRASPETNTTTWVLRDSDRKVNRVNKDASGSLWFHRFNIGIKNRMGAIWKLNKGFSTELLLAMLQKAEEKKRTCDQSEDKH